MKEYKIKITGEYDVIVLSPDMIARLVDAVRSSIQKNSSSLRKRYSRRDTRDISTVSWMQIRNSPGPCRTGTHTR